jgi:hypothetical protein
MGWVSAHGCLKGEPLALQALTRLLPLLQGCLNTSAPVGTEFVVAFTVFDSSVPANNHTALRSVTITEPCEPGLVWCSFDRLCGVTACDVRLRLVPQVVRDVDPPVVTLALPGVNLTADAQTDNAPATLTLTYGEVTTQPFSVCKSGEEPGVEVSVCIPFRVVQPDWQAGGVQCTPPPLASQAYPYSTLESARRTDRCSDGVEDQGALREPREHRHVGCWKSSAVRAAVRSARMMERASTAN